MQKHSGLAEFFRGLRSYTRVPGTLSKHKLWLYQLLPAFVSLVISSIMVAGIFYISRGLAQWIDAKIQLPIEWLDATVTWAAGILVFVAMVFAFIFAHKHIVIVVLAPFLSRVAEKITRAAVGPQQDTSMTNLGTIRRSAIINGRSIILELLLTVGLAVLGIVIPVFSPFTSLVIVLVEARFAGNGLMDFPLEYRGLSVNQSIEWSRQHKATASGVGAGYLLLMLIPIVGWMFAPTFGTVAGTLRSLDEFESSYSRP
jgi:CysZ protein